jgi:hypothetical protein
VQWQATAAQLTLLPALEKAMISLKTMTERFMLRMAVGKNRKNPRMKTVRMGVGVTKKISTPQAAPLMPMGMAAVALLQKMVFVNNDAQPTMHRHLPPDYKAKKTNVSAPARGDCMATAKNVVTPAPTGLS